MTRLQHADRTLAPTGLPIPAGLQNLTAVAVAVVTRSGDLVDANRAFCALWPGEAAAPGPRDIRPCFVNPRFDQLAARRADRPGGLVFQGPLNLGHPDGTATTLIGSVYEHGDDLLVVGEKDVAELEQLASVVLRLNEELAEQKRALVRMGREVERAEDTATRALNDREALLRVAEGNDTWRPPRPIGDADDARPPEAGISSRTIAWTDDLSTGIVSLDDEHRQMIAHYNAIVDAIDRGLGMAAVRERFEALVHFACGHFAHEERVMRNIGDPNYRLHKMEHDRLMQGALDFLHSLGNGLLRDDAPAIARYIEHWFLRHTTEQDALIREFVEWTGERSTLPQWRSLR